MPLWGAARTEKSVQSTDRAGLAGSGQASSNTTSNRLQGAQTATASLSASAVDCMEAAGGALSGPHTVGDDIENDGRVGLAAGPWELMIYRERAALHRLVSLAMASSRPSSPRPQSGAAISRSASMCCSA